MACADSSRAWSASLKTTMATLLPAKAQIVLFWGAEFVALYNDAYAPSIGDKHPRALGRPAIENRRELWDDLEPLLRGVYETGETFAAKDRPFYIERHGRGETVYDPRHYGYPGAQTQRSSQWRAVPRLGNAGCDGEGPQAIEGSR